MTAGVSIAIGTRGTAKPVTRKDDLSADALFGFNKDTEADCAGSPNREALIECFQPSRRVEVMVDGVTSK